VSGSTITIHGRLEDHDPARDDHQHAQAEQVERSEHRARGCFASSASVSAVSVRLRARIYAAISTSSAVLIAGSGAGLPSPLFYLDASNALTAVPVAISEPTISIGSPAKVSCSSRAHHHRNNRPSAARTGAILASVSRADFALALRKAFQSRPARWWRRSVR